MDGWIKERDSFGYLLKIVIYKFNNYFRDHWDRINKYLF